MVDRYVDKCLSTVIFLINLSDKSVRVEHFNRNISPLHVGCSSHVSRIYWSLLSFILFCVLCYLFFFSSAAASGDLESLSLRPSPIKCLYDLEASCVAKRDPIWQCGERDLEYR